MMAVASPVVVPGWRAGSARRLAGLAIARLANQAIGICWFVVAARVLDDRQFGILSAALAMVIVIGALSDLGVTRTVVRYATIDQRLLWPAYRRGVELRLVAGLGLGLLAIGAFALSGVDTPASAIALGAAIALASGITETAFASLRAVGLVRTEMALLVGERALFAVLALVALALGGGALAVLTVYLGTNALSAVIGLIRLARFRTGAHRPPPPAMLDAEGRRTALASTLVTVVPRLSALVLVLVAAPTAVGTLSIAQKAPEALAIFAVGVMAPLLPIVRPHVLAGDRALAAQRATIVTVAALYLLGPVIAWLIVRPEDALSLVFDASDRSGAATATVLLALAAFVVVLRTAGEQLLLADGRAGDYLAAMAAGAAVCVVLAVALVPDHGPVGAAVASLAAEGVTIAFVAGRLTSFRTRGLARTASGPVLLAGATGILLGSGSVLGRGPAVVVVALCCALGSMRARVVLQRQG
jgi:O-antigen/teichoic acid export membrane protein